MCRPLEKDVDGDVAVTIKGKKAGEKQEQEKPASPSLRALYLYASKDDWKLMSAGFVAILVSGFNQPLQLVVFGRLMDSFNLTDKEEVKERVMFFAAMYAALGIQQLVTVAVQTSCFAKVAARQAERMRLAHFGALMRKPMAFFDAPGRDAGALASSVMEKAALVVTWAVAGFQYCKW